MEEVRCPNCAGTNATRVWVDGNVLTFACNECGEEFDVLQDPVDSGEPECESIPFAGEHGLSAELTEIDGAWLVELTRAGEHVTACWFGSRVDAEDGVAEAKHAYWNVSAGMEFSSSRDGRTLTVSSVSDLLVCFDGGEEDMDRACFAMAVGSGDLVYEDGGESFAEGDVYRNQRGFSVEILSVDGEDVSVKVVAPGNSVSVEEQSWKMAELASMLATYGYVASR